MKKVQHLPRHFCLIWGPDDPMKTGSRMMKRLGIFVIANYRQNSFFPLKSGYGWRREDFYYGSSSNSFLEPFCFAFQVGKSDDGWIFDLSYLSIRHLVLSILEHFCQSIIKSMFIARLILWDPKMNSTNPPKGLNEDGELVYCGGGILLACCF